MFLAKKVVVRLSWLRLMQVGLFLDSTEVHLEGTEVPSTSKLSTEYGDSDVPALVMRITQSSSVCSVLLSSHVVGQPHKKIAIKQDDFSPCLGPSSCFVCWCEAAQRYQAKHQGSRYHIPWSRFVHSRAVFLLGMVREGPR